MGVPLRLSAFAAALLAVFGLAFGVGRATGDPVDPVDAGDEVHGGLTGDHGGGFGADEGHDDMAGEDG